MTSLDNKAFRNLLDNSIIEVHAIGEVEIFHAENEGFLFTYNVKNDVLEQRGAIQLTGEQVTQLSEIAFDFHSENAPEQNDTWDLPNYNKEYGINNAMFI